MGVISDGTTVIDNGAITGVLSWQSDIKTSAFTAVAGEGYWINTTSSAVTVTLPSSASVGDTIVFSDYARTWATNKVTVNTNSLNFQGNPTTGAGDFPEYNTNGQSVRIVYSGATQGWIPTSDDDVNFVTPQTTDVEYLVVAGGASGGRNDGGGGGAGGYLTNYGGTAIGLTPGETYTVTVGAGGSGATSNVPSLGNNGSDSSLSGTGISTITSTGGGTGSGKTSGVVGQDGGSGGGGGANPGAGGSGTVGQGNDGGSFSSPFAGGGGGAGEAGNTDGAGQGGDGLSNSITGSAVVYAGGGGGNPSGLGGDGGGTNGVDNPNGSASSPANTGGGSGGANDFNTGNGGSGVVILRLPTDDYTGTTTGSPTVTTDGTDTIIKFTGSGSYTA
jgi:hypothetical protein